MTATMTRALLFLAASATWGTLAAAKYAHVPIPILPRTVTSLDEAAVAEAQQRDDTATRAFSNVQITTSDGRCLFVDKLSGDFRENLTPIQVADCGSTDGQGWDVITSGKHNDVANSALIVSTLTNACFNFDPRRAAGNQVLLFSCGGRADGGGLVANSQLFSFNGTETGPVPLQPENQAGSCLTVKGDVVDIANCDSSDANQEFTFGSAAASVPASTTKAAAAASSSAGAGAGAGAVSAVVGAANATTASSAALAATSSIGLPSALQTASPCKGRTRTVIKTVTASKAAASSAGVALGAADADPLSSSVASAAATGGKATVTGTVTAIPQPDSAVPVSRGGNLSPSAVAEANPVDTTATRNFTSVSIRAPNGQCLFVDPTAGDFRENLIPVSLVDCSGTPNELWDIVTAGTHNNVPGTALIVSTLTNGCISFDGRRADGDTVNMFSCGGRADGSGETNADQLMPFIGAFSFAFAPSGENGNVCILPGDDNGRLVSGACPTNGAQLFDIRP